MNSFMHPGVILEYLCNIIHLGKLLLLDIQNTYTICNQVQAMATEISINKWSRECGLWALEPEL